MDVQREAAALRFRKGERLRLRTLVEQLFAKGDSLFEWPLRAVARPLGADALGAMFKGHVPAGTGRLQMLVTVPKRRRRHAVDRVLMRRRIREAWRLNRAGLRRLRRRGAHVLRGVHLPGRQERRLSQGGAVHEEAPGEDGEEIFPRRCGTAGLTGF